MGIAGVFALIPYSKSEAIAVAIPTPPPSSEFSTVPTLDQLIAMTPEQLAKVDMAVMNLRCAEDLRGAENLNIEEDLTKIDAMAAAVKYQTKKHWYKFNSRREDFNNSEPYYRMMVLATVLQEDFGIRYDPALKVGFPPPDDGNFFHDSRNVFINGLLERQKGTCSSMPALYVAVGRRLGYPLKLVPGNNHLYVKWEDGRSNFNIEATSEGMASHPDDFYWSWPAAVSPKTAEKFGMFKPFTRTQELACFLSARGEVLMATDRYEEGLKFHELAAKISPESALYQLILGKVREYVQYRRNFEQNKSLAEAEMAYQRAMKDRQHMTQNSLIPRDPNPLNGGFTSESNPVIKPQPPTPNGQYPLSRAVPRPSPRSR